MKKIDINEIQNGTIIRFKNSGYDWVCIHKNFCEKKWIKKKKNINDTDFYLFNSAYSWANDRNSLLTSIPYGERLGRLQIGMTPNISKIVGNIEQILKSTKEFYIGKNLEIIK